MGLQIRFPQHAYALHERGKVVDQDSLLTPHSMLLPNDKGAAVHDSARDISMHFIYAIKAGAAPQLPMVFLAISPRKCSYPSACGEGRESWDQGISGVV
jgi:hypothetical protein